MTPEKQYFINTYELVENMKGAHAITRISLNELYRWRWRDPEFDKAIRESIEKVREKKSRYSSQLKDAKNTIVDLMQEVDELHTTIRELKKELTAEQKRSAQISEMLLRARKGLL